MLENPPRKKLPIGIQNFAKIREDDFYYVDKTPFACRLVQEGSYYFLSRPRRFGKSLFVDTLKELFEGNRALFKGLHAESHWDWSKQHPVIRIDFGSANLKGPEALLQRGHEILADNQTRLGIADLRSASLSGRLTELISACRAQYGQRVVVLIDEYDKPILDTLEQPDTARQMLDILRDLYAPLKASDANLHFVFMTGISKFSKVGIFSVLNHLTDLTLSRPDSAICGYTEEDLDRVFAPELIGLDRAAIREWYNGYSWDGTRVYNPFGFLQFLRTREFQAYWFETSTPSFLMRFLAQRRMFLPDFSRKYASPELLSAFDVDQIGTEALLFQTGYLTVLDKDRATTPATYILGFPNREVETAFNSSLLQHWVSPEADVPATRPRLYRLLAANDLDGLRELMTGFYASIPHQWYTNNPIAQYEGYYASVFYAFFASLGLDIRVEESSNAGRLDMAVLFENRALIFEFKLVDDAPERKALAQLLAKGYDRPHRAAGREVHCIGIDFSRAQRAIVAWEMST